MGECLRCGITVCEPGRICRDCWAVDRRLCATLAAHWQQRRDAQDAASQWLDGITYVGSATANRTHR